MIKIIDWFKNVGMALFNAEKPLSDVYNSVSPCSSKLLSDTATFYLLSSVNLVNSTLQKGFVNTEGSVQYTATQDTKVLFAGSAFLEADKACRLTFQLYVNNVAISGASTIRDIVASAKITGMDLTKPIFLQTGDTVTVKANSSTANTTLIIHNINLVMHTI